MLDDRNVLDAQKVFVSMALINILKTPLSQLPFAISTSMQVCDVLITCSWWHCDGSLCGPRGQLSEPALCFRLWFH